MSYDELGHDDVWGENECGSAAKWLNLEPERGVQHPESGREASSAAIDWDGNLLPPRDLGEPDCRCASGMHTCGKSNQEEELIVALARAEELEDALGKAREQIERQAAHVGRLRDVCHRYDAALVRISAGPRPDGTYNLSREACERLAREALEQ